MNALEIYMNAQSDLENNRITLGEFVSRIDILKDVERVVRCKDCKYMKAMECPKWNREGNPLETRYFCKRSSFFNAEVVPESFCSYGEKVK